MGGAPLSFIINVGGLELVRAFLGFKYPECASIERPSGVTGAARMQRKHDHRVPSSPIVQEHGAKVLAWLPLSPKDTVLSVLQIDRSLLHQPSNAGPLLFGTSDHFCTMGRVKLTATYMHAIAAMFGVQDPNLPKLWVPGGWQGAGGHFAQ